MAWQIPKTDWSAADGVRDSDFNRIEGNTLELRNTVKLWNDVSIYVATTGSDSVGNGSSSSPYKTITHALSMIPKNLDGRNVLLYVSTGTYTENVIIRGYSNGKIILTGTYGSTATIQTLEVDSSICEVRTLGLRATSGGVTVNNGAVLLCTGSVSAVDTARGLYVLNGSTCRVYSQLTVNNAATAAVHAAGASRVYVLSLAGSDNVAAIIAEEGSIVSYGSTNITVNALTFISRTGGRITTGSSGGL